MGGDAGEFPTVRDRVVQTAALLVLEPIFEADFPHDKLMKAVEQRVVDRSVLHLLRLWLAVSVVDEREGGPPRPSTKGTPQGGVISPLLANIFLHWFDRAFHGVNGPATWARARLVRYADDFVVLARWQGARRASGWRACWRSASGSSSTARRPGS